MGNRVLNISQDFLSAALGKDTPWNQIWGWKFEKTRVKWRPRGLILEVRFSHLRRIVGETLFDRENSNPKTDHEIRGQTAFLCQRSPWGTSRSKESSCGKCGIRITMDYKPHQPTEKNSCTENWNISKLVFRIKNHLLNYKQSENVNNRIHKTIPNCVDIKLRIWRKNIKNH